MRSAQEIRQEFLKFFRDRGHEIVPSAPIVVKDDPTLMFTNAGMNQFKDIFLGNAPVLFPRVADTQKCLRVSGKHNDLEEVGVDTYHHTMFEMLGNWSLGDPKNPEAGYFKEESIAWSWELLTGIFGLDPDRLYVTVFEGDPQTGLAFDEASHAAWKKHIAEERILRGNAKDNFWEMGETGPCGPCSEIHMDLRDDAERAAVPGHTLVNQSNPEVIEIWNLVFIQYNRKADGSLENLPARHVDTGMGLERLVRAIQHKRSNYDTDLFTPLIRQVEALADVHYGEDAQKDIAIRVICDHIRAVSFCIADGQLPSNTGAGYVIRRILRRAIRYGFSFLGLQKPFFHALVTALANMYKDIFPELDAQSDLIRKVILEEESAFLRTLENGMRMLQEVQDALRKKKEGIVPGDIAFELYDTYGFPLDLTRLIARENGLSVDEKGFTLAMESQKKRSRHATVIETGDWEEFENTAGVTFLGYETLEAEAHIVKMRTMKHKGSVHCQIVLDRTPFYAESGGQTGDTGVLVIDGETIRITDTKKENDLIIHYAEKLPVHPESPLLARVDVSRRKSIMRNHTATHLLHAALRNILGAHVTQKGSYVGPDHLRFDFSHFARMTEQELRATEDLVNEKIRENIRIETDIMPLAEAKKTGAMMLFGEKYGDRVRVVTADPGFSREFCGGTHVKATGEIAYFHITAESAVAAGIRRIEAITGEALAAYIEAQNKTMHAIGTLTKGSDIVHSVALLVEENQKLKKEIETYAMEKLMQIRDDCVRKAKRMGDIVLISQIVAVHNADALKKLSYDLHNAVGRACIFLGAEFDGKALLSFMIDEALVERHALDAGKIIREAAKEIEGGGGGQKFYATAGGKHPDGLQKALEIAESLVQASLAEKQK